MVVAHCGSAGHRGHAALRLQYSVIHALREVHTSRVKLYAEERFEFTEQILEHFSKQGIMLKVKSIAGHKFVPDVKDFMLEVLWDGFEDIESSWEPLQKLMHECPAVVKNYVDGVKKANEGDEANDPEELESVLRDMAWGVCCGGQLHPSPTMTQVVLNQVL
ncbi:hypothetical protein B5M09_011568 [Aphanomyces astaci]|nr:hypothetical protein B5M09_011568 [Aphanomyces astaci]